MGTPVRETWEVEVFIKHRWGMFKGGKACEEHSRLKKLWDEAQPADKASKEIINQIASLEICNWNLEASILAICEAIGNKKPALLPIGHQKSIDKERWQKLWAYYFTLRDWLPAVVTSGYSVILNELDSDYKIQNHIHDLLGERNKLKELYVERFARCLEFLLSGYPASGSAQTTAHKAAVEKLEAEIWKLDHKARILNAMWSDGEGRLNPCHHKSFRRFDIILSSIGAGKWRAKMPLDGTTGMDRAELIDKYISPIENWVSEEPKPSDKLGAKIYKLLGEKDNLKVFLASLLVSLLRSQQIKALHWAEGKSKSNWRRFLEKTGD